MKTSHGSSPRVLLDTNVYVSYLLSTEKSASPVAAVIELAGDERFELLAPKALIDELLSAIEANPYLHQRIKQEELEEFVIALELLTISCAPLEGPFPRIVRDDEDNYLLAYAKAYGVDILVTGDKDLLVLRELLERPQIMTVREFLDLVQPA